MKKSCRFDKNDKYAQRFFCNGNLNVESIAERRFIGLIFGAKPSPYVLNSTMEKHLKKYVAISPCVDDIQYGLKFEIGLKKVKYKLSKALQVAGFKLTQ